MVVESRRGCDGVRSDGSSQFLDNFPFWNNILKVTFKDLDDYLLKLESKGNLVFNYVMEKGNNTQMLTKSYRLM